ncbi:hypothetical protein GGS21DRAFT_419770 [Xylaria nigripes]|nr:hypothetical protein GGS21DRAFT_419770 [Xylaria nigripes]
MASSLGVWPDCWGYIAALAFLAVLASLALALRLSSRWMTGSGIHLDDWLTLSALFVHHGFCATILAAFLSDGLGFDVPTLRSADYRAAMELQKLIFIGNILYGTAWTSIRLALVLHYLRIFPIKILQRGTYAIAAACVSWFIVIEALNLATCKPIAYAWNQKTQVGHCIVTKTGNIVLGALNVVINTAIVVLPLHEVFKLELSRERRLLIYTVFLIGKIAIAASVARLVAMSVYGSAAASVSATAGFEIYIAIIGTCAPTLLPIYKRFRGQPTASDTPIFHRSRFTSRPNNSSRTYTKAGSNLGASGTALRESDDEAQLTKGLNDMQVLVPPKERGNLYTDISARPGSGRIPPGGIRVQRDVTWNSEC